MYNINKKTSAVDKKSFELGTAYLKQLIILHTKVTGCVFVCLFVPKDLANCLTDQIFLNRVASHRSWKGL